MMIRKILITIVAAGAVPQKIRVEPRFKLCAERQHIEAKYPLFRKYVSAPELEWY